MNKKIMKGLSALVMVSFLFPVNITKAEEPSKPKVVITYTGSTTDRLEANELVSATICLQNVTNMTDFSLTYKYSDKAVDVLSLNSNSQITNLADDESFKDTTSVLAFGDLQKITYSVKFKPESSYSGTCKLARFVLQTKANQVLEFDSTDFSVDSFICDGKDVDYDLVVVNTTTNTIVSDTSTDEPSQEPTSSPLVDPTTQPAITDESVSNSAVTNEATITPATETPKHATIISNTLINNNVVSAGTGTPVVTNSTTTPVDDGKGDLGKGPLDGWTPVQTGDSLYTNLLTSTALTILLFLGGVITLIPALHSGRRFRRRGVFNE